MQLYVMSFMPVQFLQVVQIQGLHSDVNKLSCERSGLGVYLSEKLATKCFFYI